LKKLKRGVVARHTSRSKKVISFLHSLVGERAGKVVGNAREVGVKGERPGIIAGGVTFGEMIEPRRGGGLSGYGKILHSS